MLATSKMPMIYSKCPKLKHTPHYLANIQYKPLKIMK